MKRTFFTTTMALALTGIASQPLCAAPKEDKDAKKNDNKGRAVAAQKKGPASPMARANREVAARREAAPAPRAPQVARADVIRTPQARQTVPSMRSQPQTSRTVIESRSGDSNRSFSYTRDNDRRDNDRRDYDRRDNDRRDWGDNDRHRSWQGYRYYRAPSNAYRYWDNNGVYSWNNHRYHWYGGSWVIIDPGYSYQSTVSVIGSNVVATVQAELRDEGYNPGPVDGEMGGRTRSAIAQYQSDRGLRVTGQIDRSLLNSMGIN